MRILKLILKSIISFIVFGFFVWVFIFNWPFVFKKRIVGHLATVERVGTEIIVDNRTGSIPPQAFSFSIAIQDLKTGEIHMASSEDRKWAAAQKGNCVVAAYYPYPPWKINKGTTDYNARLIQNFQTCDNVPSELSFWGKIKFFFLWV